MATQISGDTGVSQCQPDSVSQDDLATGVVGKGPAFGAYQSTLQAVAQNTYTKVVLQTEEFDTNAAFDSVTNYRFQPSVAGYYSVVGRVAFAAQLLTILVVVYKNGTAYKRGDLSNVATADSSSANVTCLVYLNGASDYVELFVYHNTVGSQNTVAEITQTYFQGVLVRAA